MLGIFKARLSGKGYGQTDHPGYLRRLLAKIAEKIVAFLKKQEQQLTVFERKMAVLVLALVGGSYFMYLIITGLSTGPGQQIINRQPLRAPSMVLPPDTNKTYMKP